MTAYIFTAQQIKGIEQRFDKAQRAGNVVGAYEAVYQYVADVLAGKIDQNPNQAKPVSLGKDVQQVQLWFAGAARANSDKGPFAVMIRTYTEEQARLRGISITDAQMQQASNTVGFRAISDLLTKSKNGQAITLQDIADKDATAVGSVLFKNVPNNAAWAGAVLFSGLGQNEKWRLWGLDNTVNSKVECDNIKFAAIAYDKAFNKSNKFLSQISMSINKDTQIIYNMAEMNGFSLNKERIEYIQDTSFDMELLTGASNVARNRIIEAMINKQLKYMEQESKATIADLKHKAQTCQKQNLSENIQERPFQLSEIQKQNLHDVLNLLNKDVAHLEPKEQQEIRDSMFAGFMASAKQGHYNTLGEALAHINNNVEQHEIVQQQTLRLTPQGLDADKLAEAQAQSALRSSQNLGRSV
jgi:hypothetical protein